MKEFKSKEQIRSSMIRKAATLWGVQASEIESSFDPIVNLIITACASEIEKLHSELKGSHNTITEKLIELMTPEAIVGSQAAHGILYAYPNESSLVITPDYQFYHRQRNVRSDASSYSKNLFFSAIDDFQATSAQIKYLVSDNKCFQFEEFKEMEVYSVKKNSELKLSSNTIMLGISCKGSTDQLLDAPIYFDLLNGYEGNLFYNFLSQSKWFLGSDSLKIDYGLNSNTSNQIKELRQIFSTVSNKTDSVYNRLKYLYGKHYVSINSSSEINNNGLEEWKLINHTLEDAGIDLENELIWIKVVFPEAMDTKILNNLFCSFNAFPVINRRLKSFSYQLRKYINIIPLQTEDYFFDMKSLTNTSGKSYDIISEDQLGNKKGTFMLRSGSIGKLDNRSAKEYLNYLIELLKDESASFSFLNSEFLNNNVKSLNQLISILEKKVQDASPQTEQKEFLMLVPYKDNETVLVEYWTTQGEEADNLKMGSELALYKGGGISTSQCYLLSTTSGGKNNLSQNERIYAYRRSLLSRDRVVTKEDIKALCFEVYGNNIEGVEVEKKHMPSDDLSKNLILSILITIYAQTNSNLSKMEWNLLKTNTLYFLEKKSLNIYPYQIKIVH